MKIAIIPNVDKEQALLCSKYIVMLLTSEGAEVIVPAALRGNYEEYESVTFCDTYEEIFALCDCAVTVGGDGTIIHCARYAAMAGKPLLGVNMGRLGYVAELEATEFQKLTRLLSGDYVTRERMMLDVTVIHKNGTSESYLAVNDAVISRGSLSCIIDMDVYAGEEKICEYRADGLLFSTPTGSTAYALSAGGPIIDPCMNLIELTPVCPHSLTARTVIFTDDTVLSVSCNTPDISYLTVDGQVSVKLDPEDIVRVSKSEHKLMMNVLKTKNFFKIAGEKLGAPNIER